MAEKVGSQRSHPVSHLTQTNITGVTVLLVWVFFFPLDSTDSQFKKKKKKGRKYCFKVHFTKRSAEYRSLDNTCEPIYSEATLCGPPPPNLLAGRIFPRPLTCMTLHYKPGASRSLTVCSDDLDEGRQHSQPQVSVSSEASGSHKRSQRGKQEKRRLRVHAEKKEEREQKNEHIK